MIPFEKEKKKTIDWDNVLQDNYLNTRSTMRTLTELIKKKYTQVFKGTR